eukprot:1185-Rhodomonas_salina.2
MGRKEGEITEEEQRGPVQPAPDGPCDAQQADDLPRKKHEGKLVAKETYLVWLIKEFVATVKLSMKNTPPVRVSSHASHKKKFPHFSAATSGLGSLAG